MKDQLALPLSLLQQVPFDKEILTESSHTDIGYDGAFIKAVNTKISQG